MDVLERIARDNAVSQASVEKIGMVSDDIVDIIHILYVLLECIPARLEHLECHVVQ